MLNIIELLIMKWFYELQLFVFGNFINEVDVLSI